MSKLDGFVGFAWTAGSDWRGKILASHYAYPWNRAGSGYDYDELDLDVAFQGWLDASLIYSPELSALSAVPRPHRCDLDSGGGESAAAGAEAAVRHGGRRLFALRWSATQRVMPIGA